MKKIRYKNTDEPTQRLQEFSETGKRPVAADAGMVRTQIYLTALEHQFLQREAARGSDTMAGLIRRYIDEKMELPPDIWTNNPLLDPPTEDATFVGHEDDVLNHDHYIYGSPKRYEKVRGKFVEQPLIKE